MRLSHSFCIMILAALRACAEAPIGEWSVPDGGTRRVQGPKFELRSVAARYGA